MEGVNGAEIWKERVLYSSANVDYHVKNLVVSHLSSPPDLTPQEIAESSRAIAEAAALAAKAARATAVEKAAAASSAIAAAKSALHLIASFPKQSDAAHLGRDKHDLSSDKLQPGGVNVIMSNSSSSCEVPSERPNTEQAISNIADINGVGMEIDSDRLIKSAGGGDGIQVTRKRGRPKSKESKPSSAIC